MTKGISMEQWNTWHGEGDIEVVENLMRIYGNNKELEQLAIDCWNHELVGGKEPYDRFKDRFCKITSKYVLDWED